VPLGFGEQELGAVEVEADAAATDPGASVFPTGCSARINTASCPSGPVTAFGQ
jgi:hypothetical protein